MKGGAGGLGLRLQDVAFCRLLLPHAALLQAALAEERRYHTAPRRGGGKPKSRGDAPPSVRQAVQRYLPEGWERWALKAPLEGGNGGAGASHGGQVDMSRATPAAPSM